MASDETSTSIPSNEDVINEITKDINSFTIEPNSENDTETSAEQIGDNERNDGIPKEFDESESDSEKEEYPEDVIDEEKLKTLEALLTEEEKEKKYTEALELKKTGNSEFKAEKYLESVSTYTQALKLCPLKYENDRSIFYANRAASKMQVGRKKSAIEDCTKAIELNDKYIRAYLRRAKLYEEDEKLDESLADYKKILELDPGNKDALQAQYRLPPMIAERNEKMKTEMLGKLKDLGNMILKPFGLSTENFQLNQDPNTGGYSVNFSQNRNPS